MKRVLLMVIAVVLLGATFVSEATAQESEGLAAVGLNLHGYYRIRYNNTFDLGWLTKKDDGDSNWWSYFDQRMLLQPTLVIADPIQINMELDLLNNVVFGDNEIERLPTVITQRKPNDLQIIDNVRYGELDFNQGDLLSQSVSDTDRNGNPVESVRIRQLYANVSLGIGYLRFGRMASQFGMGLFANSGSPFLRSTRPDINDNNSGFNSNGGDIYDRIMFGTRIAGIYYPILMYDRIAEDDFRTGTNDVHAFSLLQYVRGIKFADSGSFDAGALIQARVQQSTDAHIMIYDLWAKGGYAGFSLEGEGAAIQGSATFIDHDTVEDLEESGLPTGEGGDKVQASAYIAATRFKYDVGRWGAGLEYGFSSPADPNPDREFDSAAASNISQAAALSKTDPDNAAMQVDFTNTVMQNQAAFGKNVFTFPFDPNYNVDLILWNQLFGPMKNAMYFKASGFIKPLDEMYIELDVLSSYINESYQGKNGEDAAHDLGWEADLTFAYTFHKRFTWNAQFGYFLPGQYFKDVYRGVENVYTIQSRAIIDF